MTSGVEDLHRVTGAEHRRAAALVIIVPVVLAALAAALVAGTVVWFVAPAGVAIAVAVLVALVVAGAIAATVPRAQSRVLGALGTRPVEPDERPRLHNLVDGLAATVGIAPPEVHLVDDDAVDVGVVGVRRPGALVVTTGALDTLDRLQLEAALARQMLELRTDAQLARTVGVGVLGRIGRPLVERADRTDDIDHAVAVDAAATTLTRHPPSLARALEVLAAHPRAGGAGGDGVAWLSSTPADLGVRAAALDER